VAKYDLRVKRGLLFLKAYFRIRKVRGWLRLSSPQACRSRLLYSLSELPALALVFCPLMLHAQAHSSYLPQGIWRTVGYGYVFNVAKDQIAEFDELGDQCLATGTRTPIQFSADFGDWEPISSRKIETWRLKTSGMEVQRLDTLPKGCAAPLARDTRPIVNFDYFWNTFNTNYAFFPEHGVDWNAVRSELRPKAAALPENGDVFPILSQMVAMLRDSHTYISDGQRSTHIRKHPFQEDIGPSGPILLDDHYMIAGFRAYMAGTNSPLAAPAQTAGNGQVLFGRIKAADSASNSASQAGIGYIAFFGMKQFGKDEGGDTPVDDSVRSARQTMQQVVASLRGVKGLVIDLRYNGGGEDAVALAISGFFADHPVEAYTKRAFNAGKLTEPYKVTVVPEDGERLAVPMVVLTSDMTVSAAEVCVLDLRVLPHSTQLGQPTRGSLSDRLSKVLPNGWKFSLSNEIYTDVHGRVFEVSGIPPDVLTDWPSPKAPDHLRFGRDIFAAVKELRSRSRSLLMGPNS
jgi:carboxyl-terminal processing protease